MTAVEKYIQGSHRGEFEWNVIESGTYGESNTVDVEGTVLEGRTARVIRNNSKDFEAAVDNLHIDPFYDCTFKASRKSARNWCERIIRRDIKNERN